MINFQFVSETDGENMRSIAVKAFEEDRKKYGAFPPGIDTIKWHINNIKSGMYYKILYNNSIIGGFKLFDLGERHYRLGAIFIDPDYHNKGIGSKAIDFIEKEYPSVKKWSLDTPFKSYRNHYFYEKLGYVKVGQYQPEQGKDFYLFLYEKNIV